MGIDLYPNPVDVILGTMATQNANNVTITGGQISVGGHAPTGVLDVQGSVVASDFANRYYGVRVWPVAPSSTTLTLGCVVEAATGAALADAGFRGLEVLNQPVMLNVYGIETQIAAGTQRYNIYAGGTAQNYFAGNVGIANGAPSYPLDVTGQARVTGTVGLQRAPAANIGVNVSYTSTSGNYGMMFWPSNGGAATPLQFTRWDGGVFVGNITTTDTSTAYNTSSDARLKHAVQALGNALSVIQALKPVSFKWNADDSPGEGFLAHELQQVIPAAVTGEPDALNDDGSIRPQQVDLSKLVPWLVGAIKELAARVEYLETQLGV